MKQSHLGIAVVVLIIAGVVWYVGSNSGAEIPASDDTAEAPASDVESSAESGVAVEPTESTTRPADVVTPPAVLAGVYDVYTPEKAAQADEGPVVLFFKASWCPSCQALDADIKANLEQIPENVTILEVDYDEYTDLRQKYGVTTQHTLVQIDENGDEIQQWSGGSTIDSVLAKI